MNISTDYNTKNLKTEQDAVSKLVDKYFKLTMDKSQKTDDVNRYNLILNKLQSTLKDCSKYKLHTAATGFVFNTDGEQVKAGFNGDEQVYSRALVGLLKNGSGRLIHYFN